MKKQMSILVLAMALLMPLASCNAEPAYTVRSIPVFGYDSKHKTDVECRYYDDIKELPYIDINTYYKLLLDKELEISTVSSNKYEVKTHTGSATIDVKEDVLYSEDYNQFINTTIYRSEGSRNGYYDGAPFLKMADYTASTEVTPKTIDFKQYKIDFKYDEGKIWAPLITFSDMFKGVTMIQSFYNGEAIYFVDSNISYSSIPVYIEPNYLNSIGPTFYKDGKRDEKLAELSYLEMCFVIDNYYGYPGRSPLESSIKQHGFDYTLENYSDSTRLTKQYLTSTDVNKYFAGMYYLSNLLYDSGHTSFNMGATSFVFSDDFSKYGSAEKVMEYRQSPEYIKIEYPNRVTSDEYKNARDEMIGDEIFISKDDTFIYRFDSFDIDYKAWDDFYSGVTNELPNDTIGNLHKGIELAKQDSNIKNFLIDLSTNGGGFGDVVVYIMGLIANKPTMYFYDNIDKRNVTQNYLCDINLDGKFDELDNTKIADFNFGIISSNYSFSCGNLLPALAKDAGIPLLGETSGGGACAVLDNSSMEGIYYRLSSFLHLTDSNYNSIDAGIDPNYDLVNIDGTRNLHNLYNFDLISQKMGEYYSK